MILKQGATRVRVCPYRCLAQWHVGSHPGPGVSWTGSRLPRHTSSPATAAAAPQRTDRAASPPSTSRDKHSPFRMYMYIQAFTLAYSPCDSHTPLHTNTHVQNSTPTHSDENRQPLVRHAEGTWKKRERKKTHKTNSVSSLWLKMWHLKKVREVEKEEKPVKLNSRVQTH